MTKHQTPPAPLGVCDMCGNTPALPEPGGRAVYCSACMARQSLQDTAREQLRDMLAPVLGAWADFWTRTGLTPEALAGVIEQEADRWERPSRKQFRYVSGLLGVSYRPDKYRQTPKYPETPRPQKEGQHMTTPTPPTHIAELEAAVRTGAEQHAEQFRPMLPELLGNMPTPGGPPALVHAALDLLGAALEETARASVKDTPSSPPAHYGAALLPYALALRLFLFELEPEDPHRAAVLFITYAARYRDAASASTPEAAAFLEQADADTLTPEAAHHALSAFPDFPTLAAFLAAHHALSLSCEALGDPEHADPRKALRDSLEVMRSEVQTVQVSGSAEA